MDELIQKVRQIAYQVHVYFGTALHDLHALHG